jgi:DNA-binding Lrp family transcriptional regulator
VLDVDCTRPAGRGKGNLPYAAPPHDLVADPRLTPTDVRVASALMFWARSKAECWPSDRTIGKRVGRSPGTVQRSLRRLEAAGWIRREKTGANRTGRLIVLAWRRAGARPLPAPMIGPPAAPARDEGTVIVKGDAPKEPATKIPGRSRPKPTPAPATAAPIAPARPQPGSRRPGPIDGATLAAWAESDDPVLRAHARGRLGLDRPPAPPPKPAPASTAEMLARIREDPRFVVQAAELLSQDLDDRKSWSGFHAACRRAWEGSIPAEALVVAHREATSGKARSPGALFMAVLKREARA